MADRRSEALRRLARLKALGKRVSDAALSDALVRLRSAEQGEEEDRAVTGRVHDHWLAGTRGETLDVAIVVLRAEAFARAEERHGRAVSELAAARRTVEDRRAAATRCEGESTVAEQLVRTARRTFDRRQEERRMSEIGDRRSAGGRRR